jgi:hypothetical protein
LIEPAHVSWLSRGSAGRRPRSIVLPFSQRNAELGPPLKYRDPTTWPRLLIPDP